MFLKVPFPDHLFLTSQQIINSLFMGSLRNFADDNTFSTFAGTKSELSAILQSESDLIIDRFTNEKMIVNTNSNSTEIKIENLLFLPNIYN